MSDIRIVDLEVYYRVGVTEQERGQPQRLLLTIELTCDLAAAAATDDLKQTIDYASLAQALIRYGEGRSWNLLEKLASNLVDMVLEEYQPKAVRIEVKKFVVPQARYVSVSWMGKRYK